MPADISTLIQACQWFPSQYLVFSENVFTPLLYYSYLGSLIPTLVIALYILVHGAKELANRLLFIMSVCFGIWVFGAMVTWATEFPAYTMFFWTLINLAEPFVYFFGFYFFYVFVFKRDFSLAQKIGFAAPLLPTLILGSTPLMLLGYDLSNCDRAAYEGVLGSYGYAIEILYVLFIVGFAIYAWKQTATATEKRQTVLLASGIFAFLLSFSLGNILEVFTENWYIGQYGLFGAPIFVAFLAYLIVRFKAFDLKLIGTQALVTALWLLVLSLLFVQTVENVRVVTSLTLIFVLVLGIFLVRSVKAEVRQRELIQKQEQELEVVNAQQEGLLHFISHEIKGYLTKNEAGFAAITEGDYGTVSEPLKAMATSALDDTRKGVETIMDILDASNLKKGTVKFDKKGFDFSPAVRNVVDSLQPMAKEKGISLEFTDSTSGKSTITGDENKLRRHVIRNLIDNSIRYTPSGNVSVALSRIGSMLRMTITDTGVGISPEDMKKLFTEGGHGTDSVKVNVHSTGYGLYIAKSIVEAHGGKIWAESEGKDRGSTFTTELPAV